MKSLTPPCSSTFLEWEGYSVMSQSLFSFMYVRNGGNQQRRLRWYLYLLQLLGASYKVSYYSKGELTQLRKYPFYWKLLFKSKPNCMSFSVQLSVPKSDWTKLLWGLFWCWQPCSVTTGATDRRTRQMGAVIFRAISIPGTEKAWKITPNIQRNRND